MPKLKIVDHDSGQRTQDFEVSEVQWPNHIPIDLEESWLCTFVKAELLLAFLGFELIWKCVNDSFLVILKDVRSTYRQSQRHT